MAFLNTRLDAALKGKFEKYAAAQDSSTSELLRGFVKSCVGTTTAPVASSQRMPLAAGRRWKVVNTRLSGAEWRLEAILTAEGTSVGRWLLSLIRARLGLGPQLTKEELVAVGQASYQLRSLGRNLNQLLRAVHQGRAKRAHFSERYAAQIQMRVTALSDTLDDLIRAATERDAV